MPEGLRVKDPRVLSGKLRNHHAMSEAGIPHVVVLKPKHEDEEATGAHAHESNEELLFNLEQEEGRIAVGAEKA